MPTVTDKSVQGIIDVLGGMSSGSGVASVVPLTTGVTINPGDYVIGTSNPTGTNDIFYIARCKQAGTWSGTPNSAYFHIMLSLTGITAAFGEVLPGTPQYYPFGIVLRCSV